MLLLHPVSAEYYLTRVEIDPSVVQKLKPTIINVSVTIWSQLGDKTKDLKASNMDDDDGEELHGKRKWSCFVVHFTWGYLDCNVP